MFPGSLEAYVQESGRAGRDGLPSRCILYYLKKEKCAQTFFLAGKYPSLENFKKLYDTLLTFETEPTYEAQVVESSKLPKTKVKVMLNALKHDGVIKIDKSGIHPLRRDLAGGDLERVMATYHAKKEFDAQKLKQMIVYSQTAMCRWKFLLKYFDQNVEWETCGHCDNCLSHHHTRETAIPGESKLFPLYA